jgi:hypothetical protein
MYREILPERYFRKDTPERFYAIEILYPPMNPSDGMKSLGMRILDHHYTIKRHRWFDPGPRRRKTATGEAKRVKMDGGCIRSENDHATEEITQTLDGRNLSDGVRSNHPR